ncbi:hypothetical protein DM02DRAFT_314019 [Periconia macrospinosa]|uniref:Uncharacterized protein n=1 Tax=Periconia macrospinosa TaxID=97972 RepID=A0A2V1DZ94_9PLEO|nr:hypothetical protein DM02DRAFT_314019 [Periconia macrospinosa]
MLSLSHLYAFLFVYYALLFSLLALPPKMRSSILVNYLSLVAYSVLVQFQFSKVQLYLPGCFLFLLPPLRCPVHRFTRGWLIPYKDRVCTI